MDIFNIKKKDFLYIKYIHGTTRLPLFSCENQRLISLQTVVMAIEKSKSRVIDLMVSLLRTLYTTNIVTPDEFSKVTHGSRV